MNGKWKSVVYDVSSACVNEEGMAYVNEECSACVRVWRVWKRSVGSVWTKSVVYVNEERSVCVNKVCSNTEQRSRNRWTLSKTLLSAW